MKKITALLTACLLLGGCTSTPAADQNNGNTDNPVNTGVTGQINVYTRDSSSGTREAYEKASDFVDQLLDTLKFQATAIWRLKLVRTRMVSVMFH